MGKFIHTYEDAFQTAMEYDSSGSLQETLKYVFDQKYSCYMLCVKDGNASLFKLESKAGNLSLDKRINKTLKRKKIASTTKTWRVMGCIIKPFKKESSFASEWVPFIESVQSNLPNGVFLLTLSDSVLVPSTFMSAVTVFAYSGKKGYKDVPIPTYDDLFDRDIGEVETAWNKKKPIAVFRGSSTGCGGTTATNQRLKLATMKSETLDVGVTQYTSHLKFNSPTDIEKVEKVAPLVSKLNWKQQSEYKYIIHVDGNVVAYRLLKSMLTKSLILRVKSDFVHWADDELKDGEHYISVNSDLSDLQEKIEWCKAHDDECKKIATNGYKFAKKVLNDEYLRKQFIKTLKSSTAYHTQDK